MEDNILSVLDQDVAQLVRMQVVSDESKFDQIYEKYKMIESLRAVDERLADTVINSKPGTTQFINEILADTKPVEAKLANLEVDARKEFEAEKKV